MQNTQRIILLILSLLVVSFLPIVIVLNVGRNLGQIFLGRSFAESQLRDYVASVLGEEINGASCQAMDSDSNGYVSCDYTVVSQPQKTRSIECASWGWDGLLNRGCRTRFPNVPNRRPSHFHYETGSDRQSPNGKSKIKKDSKIENQKSDNLWLYRTQYAKPMLEKGNGEQGTVRSPIW